MIKLLPLWLSSKLMPNTGCKAACEGSRTRYESGSRNHDSLSAYMLSHSLPLAGLAQQCASNGYASPVRSCLTTIKTSAVTYPEWRCGPWLNVEDLRVEGSPWRKKLWSTGANTFNTFIGWILSKAVFQGECYNAGLGAVASSENSR